MSTLEVRGPSLRGYRRRKAVLDLNVPPSEIREQEGTSQQAGPEEVTGQSVQPSPPAAIDVEAIDDDVIESSARAFAEVCFSCYLFILFFFTLTVHKICFMDSFAS